MTTFSEFFGVKKTQAELDFVNVPLESDYPLFIDPFAMSQRVDRWSQECHLTLIGFFQRVVDYIRQGRNKAVLELLRHLREPNETRFGYSKHRPQGAGIGSFQANQLLNALTVSSAVRTGFLNSLEETELMIEGISRDKISDLTTNVIRGHLAEYTREQCLLLDIPTRQVPLAPYYSREANQWINEYLHLPVANNSPILLVPKVIARYDLAYDHQNYYRHFVLEFLKAEALDAGSSLVRTLQNGNKVVYKKDIEATFKCTKENLYLFSREHPDVLSAYRDRLIELENQEINAPIGEEDERLIAGALAMALASISPGSESASKYHNIMIGIVEFLFHPHLIYPQKEREIHEGRKRIDIIMENGARLGFFHRLHANRGLPCAFISIECKNYLMEVSNPELDQLAGRFSPNRGKLGILCCRSFENRQLFIKRCRDTFSDDRGLIIPLDDSTVFQLLEFIQNGERHLVDSRITEISNEVCLN